MFHNKKGELKYIETNEQAKTWLGKIWQGNIPKYEVMIYLDHSFGSDPPPLLPAVYCTPYLLYWPWISFIMGKI